LSESGNPDFQKDSGSFLSQVSEKCQRLLSNSAYRHGWSVKSA